MSIFFFRKQRKTVKRVLWKSTKLITVQLNVPGRGGEEEEGQRGDMMQIEVHRWDVTKVPRVQGDERIL